ncbi:MAG: hypothetical protein OXF20_05975 [Gammaproteobacteria bacterium]|nr:hypothetical protein [Gammaproteobacteria bacterium]
MNQQNGTDYDSNLTHGKVAKLINVYLKAWFLQINPQARRVVHPPVDRNLLENVTRNILGIVDASKLLSASPVAILITSLLDLDKPEVKQWTKLESNQYENIIDVFKRLTVGHGLWKIEKFWNLH